MSTESLGIVMDVALILMLAAALVYGVVLNRKINSLHQSRRELGKLFMQFDSTIVKAQKSVSDLKDAAKETAKELQAHINNAGILINDLNYINDRATSLANKLEGKIQEGRSHEFAPVVTDEKTKRINERRLPEYRPAKQPITGLPEGSLKSPSTLESLLTKINQRIDRKKENESPAAGQVSKPQVTFSAKDSVQKKRTENMMKALGLNQNVS